MARQQKEGNQRLSPWLYDLVLWLLSLLIDLFFREVHPRGRMEGPEERTYYLCCSPSCQSGKSSGMDREWNL